MTAKRPMLRDATTAKRPVLRDAARVSLVQIGMTNAPPACAVAEQASPAGCDDHLTSFGTTKDVHEAQPVETAASTPRVRIDDGHGRRLIASTMPIDNPPVRPPPAAPTTSQAQAWDVANAAVSTWVRVDAALAPIIGQRGVAALLQRSLYLARADHPCLASALQDGALAPGDFAALRVALAGTSSADAAAADRALLQTFRRLLADLIGEALTERLLKPVWDHPSSGHAVQDTSP